MSISECCGIPDGAATPDGPSWSDLGVCPGCREHCDFIEGDGEYEEDAVCLCAPPLYSPACPLHGALNPEEDADYGNPQGDITGQDDGD